MNLKGKCLEEVCNHKKKTLSEGSFCKLEIENNGQKNIEIYNIETCITPKHQSSCDSLFIVDDIIHLVEFKGGNTKKACKQIEESIEFLKKKQEFNNYFERINFAYIIGKCNGVVKSSRMKIMESLLRNHNCKLKIKNRKLRITV